MSAPWPRKAFEDKLRENSDERKLLEANGIEVSYDGMDIIL